ncbi:MAG: Fe-S cluster assembly protein SufD [Bacteroidaceae bacterium]|nr:Fe-S cluster assembly protein SufD [Bacteroidaceae bacterium]MBQ6225754.1 Fe-S cluster assembly protein SufD [Bacteroidaceae bacterium]
MNEQRESAFEAFSAQGFPSPKVERYRYAKVEADFSPNYGIALTPLTEQLPPYCFRLTNAEPQVRILYNKVADATDSIVALNTMLCVDTLVVHVPKGIRVEHPIQISNILKGEQDTMVSRRILVVMDEMAEADIIITDRAASQSRFLTNQVIEVVMKDGSHLSLYEVEETHLLCTRYNSVFVQQGRNSSLHHTNLTLFNGHTRNRLDILLQGEGSEVTANGCVIADKMQRVDNNTLIDHQVPHCTSNELYKYVLDDSAVGAFAGKVLVREGAQKTSSKETNANLCATSSARMYTQPMLEIYADDVQCSHGSTVGQMDEAALFYMRQRGIDEKEARLLLKAAFITEVIETIPLESLRDRLHVLVDKRLRGELSKCEGCKLCK